MPNRNGAKNRAGLPILLITLIVGGGLLFAVLFAVAAGFVVWKVLHPAPVSGEFTPLPVHAGPSPPPPGEIVPRPGGEGVIPPGGADDPPANPIPPEQPAPPSEPLQSLPPAPPLEDRSPPPSPPRVRIAIEPARTFTGHTGPVFSADLSPDGQWAISAGDDKTVRLWDLSSGKQLTQLDGHTAAVRAVAFAPDGKRAVSAGDDGTLRLWDLAGKKSIRTFTGHAGAVFCAAFTPDGRQLLSGGEDRSLRIWEVETGKQLQQRYGHKDAVQSVSIAPGGRYALTSGGEGALYWDLRTGEELGYLHVGRRIFVALFTSDGKRAVVGGLPPPRLCDLTNGEQWAEENLGALLHGAALMPGSDVILLCGAGKRLQARLFYPRHLSDKEASDPRLSLLGEVEAHQGDIASVRLSADGRLALTAAEDGKVKLWRITRDAGRAEK